MRLLHIADVHLERPFRWLGVGRGDARRRALRETFSRVVDLAQKHKVDALCIAGDLYERENAPPPVGEFLRATFERLASTPVLIAPGNHDYFSPGCLYDRVPWSANVHIFCEPAPRAFHLNGATIWGMAFTGPERSSSPLADFRGEGDGLQVGLLHADLVAGDAASPYGPLMVREIAEAGLAFAMLGHVHAGRVEPLLRFAYPGSLEPLDTSESGPRWALLVEIKPESVQIECIPATRRRLIAEEIDVGDVSTLAELTSRIAGRQTGWVGADVKLRLVGALKGELQLSSNGIRDAVSGLADCGDVEIDLEIAATAPEDLDSLAREQTTRGAFVREVQELMAKAPPDERQPWEDVLATGLAAFRDQEVRLR